VSVSLACEYFVLKRCLEIGSPGFCVPMISITCATKIAFHGD